MARSVSLSESGLYASRKSEQYFIRQRTIQHGRNLCHCTKASNITPKPLPGRKRPLYRKWFLFADFMKSPPYHGRVIVKKPRKLGALNAVCFYIQTITDSWRYAGDSNPRMAFSDFLLIFRHFIFTPTKAEFNPLKPIKNIRQISDVFVKILSNFNKIFLAETKGFEPLIRLPVYYISNVAH